VAGVGLSPKSSAAVAMSAITAVGPRPIRRALPTAIANKTEARKALIALLYEARAKLAA